VAIDIEGNIAATSSTGGTRGKLPGRVGDSPILGAGAYANDICGVSTTGEGEHIIRVTLARTVTMYVEEGLDVKIAALNGIRLMNSRTQGRAGLVVADKSGDFAFSKNTRAMPTAVIQGNMDSFQSFTGIESD
jgi:beta-aspartyl-peptidase (threonine type)